MIFIKITNYCEYAIEKVNQERQRYDKEYYDMVIEYNKIAYPELE